MKIEKFYLDDGTYIRYKKIGKGAPILLLHTFRNRLEYTDKLGKLLEDKFTVYSVDLPGFGDSPINTNTNYNLNFFTKSTVNFIKLKLKIWPLLVSQLVQLLLLVYQLNYLKMLRKFLCLTHMTDSFFGEGIQKETFR